MILTALSDKTINGTNSSDSTTKDLPYKCACVVGLLLVKTSAVTTVAGSSVLPSLSYLLAIDTTCPLRLSTKDNQIKRASPKNEMNKHLCFAHTPSKTQMGSQGDSVTQNYMGSV